MKVQNTFYPDFISKTVDILLISSLITKNAQIIGCVKFWTNIMSDSMPVFMVPLAMFQVSF